jgi:galactokinase
LPGRNIVIDGNIPIGGGLSSSASLELLLSFAMTGADHDRDGLVTLARACQRAESEFAGCACGIMDQFAVALGRKGYAMRLDCRSLEFDLHRLPDKAILLVTHSGVAHQLPAGEYNSRREECEEAVRRLAAEIPGLEALRDLDLEQLEAHRGLLGERLFRRCRHVVTENARVGAAVNAMQLGDMAGLGRLMSLSHDSLRDDYEVSCNELDRLVDIALGTKGVLGSRMMGGGFGGCTLTLVEEGRVATSVESIAEHYGALLGSRPWMHVVRPTGPVTRLEV